MRQATRLRRAIELADRLIDVTSEMDDEAPHKLARRLRHRLQPAMEMADILALVPGDTVTAQAELLEVSRQTYYTWLEGRGRPGEEAAARLAELTGIAEDVILGR